MDFKSQPMAGAVEKTLHPPIALAGLVAFFLKEFYHQVVHFAASSGVTQVFERQFLSSFHGMIKTAQSFAGAAFHHRSSDVSEVAGALRTWEHINNDGLI